MNLSVLPKWVINLESFGCQEMFSGEKLQFCISNKKNKKLFHTGAGLGVQPQLCNTALIPLGVEPVSLPPDSPLLGY